MKPNRNIYIIILLFAIISAALAMIREDRSGVEVCRFDESQLKNSSRVVELRRFESVSESPICSLNSYNVIDRPDGMRVSYENSFLGAKLLSKNASIIILKDGEFDCPSGSNCNFPSNQKISSVLVVNESSCTVLKRFDLNRYEPQRVRIGISKCKDSSSANCSERSPPSYKITAIETDDNVIIVNPFLRDGVEFKRFYDLKSNSVCEE